MTLGVSDPGHGPLVSTEDGSGVVMTKVAGSRVRRCLLMYSPRTPSRTLSSMTQSNMDLFLKILVISQRQRVGSLSEIHVHNVTD